MNTSQPGTFTYTVTATSQDGQTTTTQITYSVTSAPPSPTPTPPTTSTTSATPPTPSPPTTQTSTTPPITPPPVALQITAISATDQTILWCQGTGCRYPATSLRFTLNRATTVRLVLRTHGHGHFTPVASTTLHGHRDLNRDRIAGRWHGHLFPTGPVQILVQIQPDHHWQTAKTITLTVRHTSQPH